jgi:hypothetical protein
MASMKVRFNIRSEDTEFAAAGAASALGFRDVQECAGSHAACDVRVRTTKALLRLEQTR